MQPIPIMVMNGFGFMFKRQLIKEIGVFDHVNFPFAIAIAIATAIASVIAISLLS
jgi:hypothetical protein